MKKSYMPVEFVIKSIEGYFRHLIGQDKMTVDFARRMITLIREHCEGKTVNIRTPKEQERYEKAKARRLRRKDISKWIEVKEEGTEK